MKYKVLISFIDDHDKDAPPSANVYWAGAKYPRDEYEPSAERVSYLQSNKTSFKKPVISGKKAK